MSKKKVLNGVFYVTENYDKDLEFMPYAQAGVNVTNYGDTVIYTLRSYCTNILALYVNVKTGAKFLEIGQVNYSRSTMRHVSAFLKEYLPPYITYHFLRDIYVEHEDLMVLRIPEDCKDYDEDDCLFTEDEFYKHFLEPQIWVNEVQHDL